MKKHKNNFLVLGLVCMLCFCTYLKFANAAIETVGVATTSKVIVIDAGHGGYDPGKAGPNGTLEDEINLDIALKLKDYLEQSGATVVMTRMDDEYLQGPAGNTHKRKDMSFRKQVMKESEADVMVSIHQNAFPQSEVRGAQVFYYKDAVNAKLLAYTVQEAIKNYADSMNGRQIKSSKDYYILNECSMPAIIVECGFLTNPQEEQLLATDEYQDKMAWAIYIGLIEYFEQLEGK